MEGQEVSANGGIMQQGSLEWLKWRHEGIGASDTAALLGLDIYGKTPRTLYLDKTAPMAEASQDTAEHLRAGHEIESMVRAMHEFDTGEDFPPACFEHPEYPFIRASLDGWSDKLKEPIEIKMVAQAAMGTPVPPHHMVQCQKELLVTGASAMTYIRHCRSTAQTEKIRISEDRTIQRDILAADWKFWDAVQRRTAPDYIDADWVPSDDPALMVGVDDWKAAQTTKDKKNARGWLLSAVDRPRTLCGGVKIQRAPFTERVSLVKVGVAGETEDAE